MPAERGPTARALPVAYTLALFGLASIPGAPRDGGGSLHLLLVWMPPALQNLLHVPQYALLAWLWRRAGAGVPLAIALSLGYAAFEEVYQTTVPGRFGSWTDLALDLAGIVLGIALHRAGTHRARTGPVA